MAMFSPVSVQKYTSFERLAILSRNTFAMETLFPEFLAKTARFNRV
jgi:hypothetical protein